MLSHYNNKKKRRLYLIGMIVSGIIACIGVLFFFYSFYKGSHIVDYFGDYQAYSQAINSQVKRLPLVGILLFLSMICFVLLNVFYRGYRRLNAGIQGEIKTQKILSSLPSQYQVLCNVPIKYEDKRSEIDHLIISPKGIVIVETKSFKGILEGYENDNEWTYTKTSSKGNQYVSTIKNPLKQTKRQTYILSQILKQNHMNCWIDSYVIILEGQCYVHSKNIFLNKKSLIQKILSSGQNNTLKEKDIQKIKNILSTFIQ